MRVYLGLASEPLHHGLHQLAVHRHPVPGVVYVQLRRCRRIVGEISVFELNYGNLSPQNSRRAPGFSSTVQCLSPPEWTRRRRLGARIAANHPYISPDIPLSSRIRWVAGNIARPSAPPLHRNQAPPELSMRPSRHGTHRLSPSEPPVASGRSSTPFAYRPHSCLRTHTAFWRFRQALQSSSVLLRQ